MPCCMLNMLEDQNCLLMIFAIQILPPSRDLILDIAVKKNSEPLPLISDRFIKLPPDEYSLFGQQSKIFSGPLFKSKENQ